MNYKIPSKSVTTVLTIIGSHYYSFSQLIFGSILFLISTSFTSAFQAKGSESFEKVHVIKTTDPFARGLFVTTEKKSGHFPVVENGNPTPILISESDYGGVQRVGKFFQEDLSRVSGKSAALINKPTSLNNLIIVGSIDRSPIIKNLISQGKIDVKQLEGKWEKFLIVPVKNPMEGVKNGLVIAGSDKRGTIFGMLELSEQMGVSPWYWWADVPVKMRENIYVKKGVHTLGEPSVKYRGIFINDEAPALTGWVYEKFGDFNHEFYEKVFELILRNKGNYLWPAMWRPRVFSTDDPENLRLADEYGIVISTSHHEPMMRYHEEWSRYDGGDWNYKTNKEKLQEFWRGGIERMGDYESVVTMGMRGDGDEAMSESTAVGLMKEIIADQRKIIKEVTGKPAKETPQVWAIYKEVQDYYDKGLRVDDDILVLFCDDNWGNIRIVPKKEDLNHEGGYGLYYHFDFVGGPVSYRWLNVTQIEKVWEQMNLAYEWGIQDLWLVNVGDIKPMELPIDFFLDFAWNAKMEAKELPNYYRTWAAQQFGENLANEVADILALSTKYSARRTPEMLKPNTYSLTNYNEAETILKEYSELFQRSENIYSKLPETSKSAYYQIVHFPIEVLKNLNEMYVAAGKNSLYAMQGRASTNHYADLVIEKFKKDKELTDYYNKSLAGGKWNHFMDQKYIGYTSWNEPRIEKMPEISYVRLPSEAGLGYILENGVSRNRWFGGGLFSNKFNSFDKVNNQTYEIDLFNTGTNPLEYTLKTDKDWINISKPSGTLKFEEKITVGIDWSKVSKEDTSGKITLSGDGRDYEIEVPINTTFNSASGYIESNGVVSIDAAKFSSKKESSGISWTTIPNMGRTNSSITVEPANANAQLPTGSSPRLDYVFTLQSKADIEVHSLLSPTLNFKKEDGLKFAISIDGQTPQIVNIHEGDSVPDWEYPEWWNKSVTDRVRVKKTKFENIEAGTHTLKIFMIDPGVVFQKFIVDAGGLKDSYLGPPTSMYIEPKK
ncbi:glycosyl hydrolase 115 family protein [Aegicerativicinus sediminis]|uniref:glycosyl hydrolase 115 family protein n=1 Tax=Aegicerativicinus sediminis TaxID=2893202 RepID=UPI001E32437A|nr:glycosyl hydrolase 115 family protein [Aegicerativicinus sediminis]